MKSRRWNSVLVPLAVLALVGCTDLSAGEVDDARGADGAVGGPDGVVDTVDAPAAATDAAVPSGPTILTAPAEQTFLNEVSPTYTFHTLFGNSYLTLPI